MRYPIVIRPIPDEEGGGYLALFPDLVGCVSDGETPEEALANAREAFEEWMETSHRHGSEVPEPNSGAKRAAARQQALREAVRALATAFSDVDGRIESLEGDIADLKEQVEHAASWARFSEITGVQPDETATTAADRPRIC